MLRLRYLWRNDPARYRNHDRQKGTERWTLPRTLTMRAPSPLMMCGTTRVARPRGHPLLRSSPRPLPAPGGRLHALKGDRKEFLALRLSARWRFVVWFEGADAYDVEVADYRRS